jgi:hypothetical protein
MLEIRTTIDIDAGVETVWSLLMDFDSYPEWNPFVRSVEGSPVVGERLVAVIGASGKKAMKISPVVQEVEAPRSFSWLGSVGRKGIFDGEHHFEIVEIEEGTRFDQYEKFSGFLAPVVIGAIRKSTTRGFEEMNRALKSRAEGSA